MNHTTLAMIVGTRDFFPAEPVLAARREVIALLQQHGVDVGIPDASKLSELQVPILVQAYPDPLDKLGVATRGDAYCGKISLTNNLYQYGYPFTLTDEHTVHPLSARFSEDLRRFIGVCRVVRGLRR